MLLLLASLGVALAGGGRLAEAGESLGDATVLDVVEHAEFQRVVVTLPSGAELTYEVTSAGRGSGAICAERT